MGELGGALSAAGALGVDRYEQIRDDLIERVIEAKLRRLATARPVVACRSPSGPRPHARRAVDPRHDEPHGAPGRRHLPRTARCRPPAERRRTLQPWRRSGEVAIRTRTGVRGAVDVPTMKPARLREIGDAYRAAFVATSTNDVAYNRPYLGGHETQIVGPLLRDLEPLAVVRTDDGPARRMRFGAGRTSSCASSCSVPNRRSI